MSNTRNTPQFFQSNEPKQEKTFNTFSTSTAAEKPKATGQRNAEKMGLAIKPGTNYGSIPNTDNKPQVNKEDAVPEIDDRKTCRIM